MRFVNFYRRPISIFVMVAFTILLCFWANQSPAASLASASETDTTKAMELIKKGNESFQVYKNLSQAYKYFKEAAGLASNYIKIEALLGVAYMSHLLGNKISEYQNFIKEALNIDPEIKLEPIDYSDSFIKIFYDIRNRETTTKMPTIAKPSPKTIPVQPQPTKAKPVIKNSFEQEGSIPVVKKKFPWLIVGAGAVTVVVLVALLSKKKATTPTPTPKGSFTLGTASGTAIYANLVNFHVTLNNIGGGVTYWKFIIKKDNNLLLEINKDNYNSLYKLSISSASGSYSIPANTIVGFNIIHDSGNYINGNPFGQNIPNNFDFYVTIVDTNGYEHSLTANFPFYFINLF
jgi:hypothetical protein